MKTLLEQYEEEILQEGFLDRVKKFVRNKKDEWTSGNYIVDRTKFQNEFNKANEIIKRELKNDPKFSHLEYTPNKIDMAPVYTTKYSYDYVKNIVFNENGIANKKIPIEIGYVDFAESYEGQQFFTNGPNSSLTKEGKEFIKLAGKAFSKIKDKIEEATDIFVSFDSGWYLTLYESAYTIKMGYKVLFLPKRCAKNNPEENKG